MFVGVVVGNVVSTTKNENLVGYKLLVVRPIPLDGEPTVETTLVAIDTVDAGIGDKVLVTMGSPARMVDPQRRVPIDAAIVGVVDSIHMRT